MDIRYFTDMLFNSREEATYLIQEGYVDYALQQYHDTMDFIAKDAAQLNSTELDGLRSIASSHIKEIKEAIAEVPEHRKAQVCRSAAGYYIGTWHPEEGPYERYSEYYGTHEDAQDRLQHHRWVAGW